MLFLLCSLLGSLSSRDTSQPACLPCLPDPPPRRLLDFHGPLRVTLIQSTFMEGFENNVLLPWILYFRLHKHLGRYCYCQSEIRGTEGVRDFHVTTELRDFHVTTEQSHHSLLTLHQQGQWPHLLSLSFLMGRKGGSLRPLALKLLRGWRS